MQSSPKATNTFDLQKVDYQTSNTIDVILKHNAMYRNQTAFIAASFKGKSDYQMFKNIFDWIFANITYKIDPLGFQFVKSPSKTMADGFKV